MLGLHVSPVEDLSWSVMVTVPVSPQSPTSEEEVVLFVYGVPDVMIQSNNRISRRTAWARTFLLSAQKTSDAPDLPHAWLTYINETKTRVGDPCVLL